MTGSVRSKVDSGPRREKKDGDPGRGPRGRGRGRGRAETIQSHSIFEQGPAEMAMKKRSRGLSHTDTSTTTWAHRCPERIPCCTGAYENEKDAPSTGPSPIINIKKEKRETEEETKEILRSLERDNVGPRFVGLE